MTRQRTESVVPSIVSRVGLALFGAGGLGDLLYHALPRRIGADLTPLLGPDGARAHLVTLAGMALIVSAVIQTGWTSRRRPHATPLASHAQHISSCGRILEKEERP